jgi:hypothetical protein
MENKEEPESEYEKGSTSGTKDELPDDGTKKNPKDEENEEDNDDLESITELPNLNPEMEVEDQGAQGVIVADNWGEWALVT